MDFIERVIQVSWPLRVWFTRGVFAAANPLLGQVLAGQSGRRPARALVVLDEALAQAQPHLEPALIAYCDAHADQIILAGPPFVLEGGERVKNSYFHVSEIHSRLDRYRIDRHSYVLGVGGGALLDVVGLAAATAHRGVRHVRLPSTTLSQADSGVGVKNGLNAFGKKNFIGTFAPPFAVLNDFDLLASLPPRHQRSGFVEAVKVAVIRDAAFFRDLEAAAGPLTAFEPEAVQWLIQRCAELHLDHIAGSGDPFELGSARPLDFGHWAAHKLEQLSEYHLLHGEAVAVGMALDVVYSRRQGWLEAGDAERILALLEGLGFDLYTHELEHQSGAGEWRILEGLDEFREHLGGELTVTLPRRLGQGFEVHEMHPAEVMAAVRELRHRQQGRRAGNHPDLELRPPKEAPR